MWRLSWRLDLMWSGWSVWLVRFQVYSSPVFVWKVGSGKSASAGRGARSTHWGRLVAPIHHNVWQHQFTHHQRCLGAWCLLQYLARESSQSSHAQIPVKLQSSAMERREQLFAQELTHFAIARENAIFDDSFDSFQLLVIVGVVGILPRIEISRDSASSAVHSTCNYGFFFARGNPHRF